MTFIPDHDYGTTSNKIVSLMAVVWDQDSSKNYTLKAFQRTDTDSSAFLVNLGRAFLTDVTFIVGNNYKMSCLSRTDIGVDELFGSIVTPNTAASLLNKTG